MLFFKNGSKSLLISLITFLILTFIITILNYIGLFNLKAVNVLKYIVPFISFFIGSFILGVSSIKKGWLEGIKFGLISLFILFIFNFLAMKNGYSINNIIFYFIVISSAILGSMIGINTKKNVN